MLCLFSGALLELQVKVETLGSVDPEFPEWEAEIDEVSTLKGEEKGEVIPIGGWEEEGSEEEVAQQIRQGHSRALSERSGRFDFAETKSEVEKEAT